MEATSRKLKSEDGQIFEVEVESLKKSKFLSDLIIDYPDEELNHALLNSMFTMFFIEAAGFGRGLGVLDINKNNVANCYMLNPKLVSSTDRQKILF